jgi:Tol biopolymer transport system component
MVHQAKAAAAMTDATATRGATGLMASALAIACAVFLGACSGDGSGGKDVTIGSGQSADPVTLDFPVVYVKRPVPDPDDPQVMANDARILNRFEIGADLFLRDRASPSAPEINLTEQETAGLGDIRDVDINFDGTKVVFSMRAKFIEGADEEDQPTWNVWEYDVKAKLLRRVIASDTTAEEGHDIMPHYLPDGRIVFTSTRQRQSRAILLDENKPQYAAQDEDDKEPAFLLHVMDADGSNIHQISFNQSHDLDPTVLNDGRIAYTRWEHAPGSAPANTGRMDLFTVNPDGTNLQLLYGTYSHDTGTIDPVTGVATTIQFLSPRAMPDGRTLAIIRPFTGTQEGGDLVLIDTDNYVDNTQTIAASAGLAGPAQKRALPTDVRTSPGPSPGGRYRSAAPLFDGTNRLLVSWSQCRLVEAGRIVPCTTDRLNNTTTPPVEAPPLFGVYIYDVNDNTQKPIVAPQEGFIFTEVVAGSSRTLPPVILDKAAGVDYPDNLLSESVGILHIRSVYDIDGKDTATGGIAALSNPGGATYATRPARFLRIEKVVSQPDEDTRDVPNTAFGPNGRRFGMRDILGYAPIEPDGSVKVKVPANVAFAISVLDKDGRRLGGALGGRHTNWLQVMPGETLECNGCHDANARPPIAHGRAGLTAAVNTGATTTGAAFPNTNPLLAPLDAGETMAQARGRAMCGGTCAPSVDIVFDDYWPSAALPKAAAYDMCYSSGASNLPFDPTIPLDPANPASRHTCVTALKTVAPTTKACETAWSSRCRTTINYEQNIHPLWGIDRFVDVDMNGVNDMDGNGAVINHKCNACHNTVDAANAAAVPAGQLDLTDGPSDDEPKQFRSYRELLFADTELELQGGVLVEKRIQVGIDPDTNLPITEAVPVSASMSAAGARSSRFFQKFDAATGTVDHRGYLNPAELRLLAEWLDIGAQYYNDPFVAPEN